MAKRNKAQKKPMIIPITLIFLVLILIYLLTPTLYTKIKEREYDHSFAQLTTSLTTTDDPQSLIIRYAVENNAYVSLECPQDTTKNQNSPVLSSVYHMTKSDQLQLKDGLSATLRVQYANQEYRIVRLMTGLTLTICGILLIMLMQLFQHFNRHNLNSDFEEFKNVTYDMINRKPKAHLSTASNNKVKNKAAEQINELYSQLLQTTQSLKNKIKESNIIEEQTMSALKELNQSISAPIDKIKTMVTGMINDEGIYKNHHIYLIETKMKLEELQVMIDQKLKTGIQTMNNTAMYPISIQEYFLRLTAPYELLALEKRIGFRYSYEDDFKMPINDFMFNLAFRHLMEFTLKQCQPQSNILIIQNQYDIIIAYKGAALTPASAKRVIETDEDMKTLFKIIKSLGLYLDYEATQKKDGMQFVFHF